MAPSKLFWLLAVTLACGCGGQSKSGYTLPSAEKTDKTTPQVTTDLWQGKPTLDTSANLDVGTIELAPLSRLAVGSAKTHVVWIASESQQAVCSVLVPTEEISRQTVGRAAMAHFILADRIAAIAGDITFESTTAGDRRYFVLSGLRSQSGVILKILAQLAQPKPVSSVELEKARESLLAEIAQRESGPASLAAAHFLQANFGQAHPAAWLATDQDAHSITGKAIDEWLTIMLKNRPPTIVWVGPAPANFSGELQKLWRPSGSVAVLAAAPNIETAQKVRLVDLPGLNRAILKVGLAQTRPPGNQLLTVSIAGDWLRGPGGPLPALAAKVAKNASLGLQWGLVPNGLVADFTGEADPGDIAKLYTALTGFLQTLPKLAVSQGSATAAGKRWAGRQVVGFSSPRSTASQLSVFEHIYRGTDLATPLDGIVLAQRVSPAQLTQALTSTFSALKYGAVIVGDARTIAPLLKNAGIPFDLVTGGELTNQAATPRTDAASVASAQGLLKKALAVKGGATSSLKSIHWRGKAQMRVPGGTVLTEVEKAAVMPAQMRLNMFIPSMGATIVTALDGESGWALQGQGKTDLVDFPASEVRAGKRQLWRDPDWVIVNALSPAATLGKLPDVYWQGVAQHAVYVANPALEQRLTLIFDKKTHELAGMQYTEDGLSTEERYSNYKKVSGVAIAHERVTKNTETFLRITLGKIEINPTIPSQNFAKPKP